MASADTPSWDTAGTVQLLARLAAHSCGRPASIVVLAGEAVPVAMHGLTHHAGLAAGRLLAAMRAREVTRCEDVTDEFGDAHRETDGAHTAAYATFGAGLGWVMVLGREAGERLSADQVAALQDVAGLVAAELERTRRDGAMARITARVSRADAMLRLVSDAATCADALTSVLRELCSHYDALAGRIWQLSASGLMQEVSRYKSDEPEQSLYYSQEPAEPVSSHNSMTALAIQRNEPLVTMYSQIERPERYVLLEAAINAGFKCQISFPIWVDSHRFGLSLAFTKERSDLDAITADIALLANTIRPALFRKVAEESIRHMAHHDDLTGLSNRSMFNARLHQAVAEAGGSSDGLALLYLDLDGFKQVNDTRGHEAGDRLLAAVARRLRDAMRESDLVARIGGDEFAVVQRLSGQPGAATTLAARLLRTMAAPFELGSDHMTVGVSVGIAVHPSDGTTPDMLQRNADTALYTAKAAGRNTWRRYEPSMDVQHQARTLLQQDLKAAIGQRAFWLAYQPIRRADSLEVFGLEALLRWTHAERGVIAPSEFVPLAETSGLILGLGQWALETACLEAAGWASGTGHGGPNLSVNFSPLQFRQPDLSRQIAQVLSRTGLAAARLDLEVTEGLLLDDSGQVLRTMHELQEQGVHITLDDFGTAYASLSYLRRFPFDRIKIDRSFVQGMVADDSTLAIVQAVLSLSRRLEVSVVAEGVETEEELGLLRRLGCPFVQGYLTGRPMAAEDARALLAR